MGKKHAHSSNPRSTSSEKDEVVEGGGSALKIKIKAPPVDGKANDYLVRFLAEQFDVPLSHIELVKGTQNRNKIVKIDSPKKLIAEIKAYTATIHPSTKTRLGQPSSRGL